jgi:hypothetical protein
MYTVRIWAGPGWSDVPSRVTRASGSPLVAIFVGALRLLAFMAVSQTR